MAKKDTRNDDDIIDLTELIESGDRGDSGIPSANLNIRAEDDAEDDFAAILAETAAVPDHKVDPDEKLDMSGMGGIDNLLESLDIPSQSRDDPSKAQGNEDDLDSVLDDLLGNDEPKKESSPKQAPVADNDLDSLFNDVAAPAKTADSQSAPPDEIPAIKPEKTEELPKATELDSDLDDILATFDEPARRKDTTLQEKEDESNLAADLDDILGDVELPPPPAPKSENIPESAIEEVNNALSEPLPEAGEELSLLGEADEAALSDQHGNLPDEQDKTGKRDLPAQVDEDAARMPARTHASAAADAEALLMRTHALPPETLAGICRNISSAQESQFQHALQEFSRELGEQSAHVEDMGAQIVQLGKRLLACESKLSAARARIASLEKAMESAIALEDLLKEGTPLHSGFMTLISTAVSNALNGFKMPDADTSFQRELTRLDAVVKKIDSQASSMDARLSDIEKVNSGASGMEEEIGRLIASSDNSETRIKSLETKLALIEQGFGKEMEKAAAATVARILHEEISRLAQG